MHPSKKTGQMSRLSASIICAAATCLAMGTAVNARADVLTEEHQYHLEVIDPTWETTYNPVTDLVAFDTLGGTRQLLCVDFVYSMTDVYRASIAGNLSALSVGAHAEFNAVWSATLPQPSGLDLPIDWFINGSPGLSCGSGLTGVAYPFSNPQEVGPFDGGIQVEDSTADPAYLAAFTGTGLIPLQNSLTVSNVTYPEPDPRDWFPNDPPDVYDPGILQILYDQINVDMTVTYRYLEVPEPGTMAILALGGLALLRRR